MLRPGVMNTYQRRDNYSINTQEADRTRPPETQSAHEESVRLVERRLKPPSERKHFGQKQRVKPRFSIFTEQ